MLLTIAKPSGGGRGKFANLIATQVRSVNVHFRLRHAGLRTESFIFFGDAKKADLTNPYLQDWGRPSSPSIYQHPEYQVAEIHWFYDVWSLMMILRRSQSGNPLIELSRTQNELLRKKWQRKEVMDAGWKGERTAKIMQYGFKFLEGDRFTLENLSRKEVKRFFDALCSLIGWPWKVLWRRHPLYSTMKTSTSMIRSLGYIALLVSSLSLLR